jgi:hypothetical protein
MYVTNPSMGGDVTTSVLDGLLYAGAGAGAGLDLTANTTTKASLHL